MTQDQELLDYLLLLRYGPAKVPGVAHPILNLSSVARMVKMPLSTVRDLIRVGLKSVDSEIPVEPKNRKKLEEKHIEYLIDKHTLVQWAHLSLK